MKLNIKKPIYSAIIFFFTLGILYISYGAYSTISKVGSGSGLTYSSWNQMVDNFTDLNSRSWSINGANLYYNGGNVGIGTDNPIGKLDINVTSGNQLDPILRLRSTLNSSASLVYYINLAAGQANPLVLNGDQALIFSNDSSATSYTNGLVIGAWTDKGGIKIMENGNVGIGTTAPSEKLEVAGNIKVSGGGNLSNIFIGKSINGYTSTFPYETIMLDPTNNLRINFGNSEKYILQADGVARAAGSWTNYSDIRLKKDINPISSGISTINHLRGVTYYWKDKTLDQSIQYGLIAQEVEKVLPDLVKTDDKGFKSVNYIGVIPVLVKSAQELNDKLLEKDKQIEDLNNRLIKLEK